MIVTYPVMYPAAVVRAGRRREETVLLAAPAHFRIDEPSGLGTAIRLGQTLADRIAFGDFGDLNDLALESGLESEYLSESEESGTLLAPLRLRDTGFGIARSTRVDAVALEAMGAAVIASGRQLGVVSGQDALPFQSREVLALHGEAEYLPVLSENEPFRRISPIGGDSRDRALAHASAVASTMRADRAGGIWAPTRGPFLHVTAAGVRIHSPTAQAAPAPVPGTDVRFRVDQADEAVLYAGLGLVDGAGNRLEVFRAEVLRPAAHRWSPLPFLAFHAAQEAIDRMGRISDALNPRPARFREGAALELEQVQGIVASAWTGGDGEAGGYAMERLLALLQRLRAATPGWPPSAFPDADDAPLVPTATLDAVIRDLEEGASAIEWGVNEPIRRGADAVRAASPSRLQR